MPRAERDRIERLDELYGFLEQSNISKKNAARLEKLVHHNDREVAQLAGLLREIARFSPGKRRRWRRLAEQHRPVFERAVQVLGIEFFEDILIDYGDDFDSPLQRIFEQCITSPLWTARACDCGSGVSFRDCCMDRENGLADEWAYEQWIAEREQELDEERRQDYFQGFCGSDGSRDASLWERALVGSQGGFEEFD
ncbi:hypothetical protein SDC9_156583 [bioreactor metagenome]|uniref:Uncharacterized protein n=1 Tax=bioreactor metagenome TaxID=1076179 RepID=A0A645F9P6_9ZZZZ